MAKDKEAVQAMEKFDTWMKERIQNIHYASNQKMSTAHQKVYKEWSQKS